MSVAKSVGGGGVVSAERCGGYLVGIDVIVLEDCSLAQLGTRDEEGEERD
jgi:hypothetical protein